MKTSFGVLLTRISLPAAAELAVQQPVPEQEAQLLLVEPDLAQRLDRVVGLDLDGEVAQVQLLRRVDLRVAVEQHAQQRRARADAAHHERRRDQQPVARLARRVRRRRARGRAPRLRSS